MAHVYELFPRLKERENQRAGTMSGGEQQMLAIGRALMSNPRMLFLDEPSLGLAPIIIQQIFDIISMLRDDGVTIFLVEQNANQALGGSPTGGYVLENGRIVLQDTGAALLTQRRSAQRLSRRLISHSHALGAAIAAPSITCPAARLDYHSRTGITTSYNHHSVPTLVAHKPLP